MFHWFMDFVFSIQRIATDIHIQCNFIFNSYILILHTLLDVGSGSVQETISKFNSVLCIK